MSKTKEELNAIKEEVETVNKKLQELTPEEIAQVSGGIGASVCIKHIETDVELGSESVKQKYPAFDPKKFIFGQIGAGN